MDEYFGLPFILMDTVDEEDELRLGKSLTFVFKIHDQNMALLKYVLDFETVRSGKTSTFAFPQSVYILIKHNP